MMTSKNIAFKYSDTKLTDLTFSSVASNQLDFESLKIDVKENVEVVQVRLLSGRLVEHRKYVNTIFNILLSTNALNPIEETLTGRRAIADFIRNWWKASFKYICLYKPAGIDLTNYNIYNRHIHDDLYLYDTDEANTYIEVVTGGGKVPYSSIDDIAFLPEISLLLTSAEQI